MATKPRPTAPATKPAPAPAPAPGKAVARTTAAPPAARKPAPGLEGLDDDDLAALEDELGSGMEDFGKNDLSLPFLRILQSLSPQALKANEKFIKGAEAGMFIETLSGQIHEGEETGVLFIPCYYTMSYTQWTPRDEGGGFKKDHGADPRILDKTSRDEKTNKDLLSNGDEILTSAMYYGILVDEETGEGRQVLLPLSGTQIKKSRRWNSQIASTTIPDPRNQQKRVRPPMYFSTWRLTSLPEHNDKGDWYGISVALEGSVFALENGKELFQLSKTFREMVASGNVKVNREELRPSADEDIPDGDVDGDTDGDDETELPF